MPNGGYLGSILMKAAQTNSSLYHGDLDQPDIVHMFINFLNRAQVGPAEVMVTDAKIGRNYSSYRLLLKQHGTELIHSYIQMANFDRETGPSVDIKSNIKPRRHEDYELGKVAISEFRRISKHFEYKYTHDNPMDVQDTFISFKSGRPWDLLSFAVAADITSPVPRFLESDGIIRWYPTVTMEIEFKRKPKNLKWVRAIATVKGLINGRNDLNIALYDEEGNLLANSHHVALVVDASRNLKKKASI